MKNKSILIKVRINFFVYLQGLKWFIFILLSIYQFLSTTKGIKKNTIKPWRDIEEKCVWSSLIQRKASYSSSICEGRQFICLTMISWSCFVSYIARVPNFNLDMYPILFNEFLFIVLLLWRTKWSFISSECLLDCM